MSQVHAYIGAALAAIAGIFFFVLVLPAYDGVSSRRTALAERNDLITEQTATVAKLADLNKQYAARAGDIKQFSYVVPSGKNTADLVSMLQALVSQNGLQLTGLSMGANTVDDKAPYYVQSIDIGMSGGYVAFRSFMEGIERNIRMIDIDSIDAAPVSENSPTINFRIKAHAYFLK